MSQNYFRLKCATKLWEQIELLLSIPSLGKPGMPCAFSVQINLDIRGNLSKMGKTFSENKIHRSNLAFWGLFCQSLGERWFHKKNRPCNLLCLESKDQMQSILNFLPSVEVCSLLGCNQVPQPNPRLLNSSWEHDSFRIVTWKKSRLMARTVS